MSQTPSILLERDKSQSNALVAVRLVSPFSARLPADCFVDDVDFFDDVLAVEVKQLLLERMVSVC